jgi:hypothetical protein
MGFENSCKRIIRPQPPRGARAARSAAVEGSNYSLRDTEYGTFDLMSTFFKDSKKPSPWGEGLGEGERPTPFLSPGHQMFGLDELHRFWHFLIFSSIRLTEELRRLAMPGTAPGCAWIGLASRPVLRP